MNTPSSGPEPATTAALTRRLFLQYSGLAAAAVTGGGLLAACGGDDGGGGGGGGGGGPQNSGGQLIHGATGGGSKDTLDPHQPVQAADISRVCNLYEPLLFWNGHGGMTADGPCGTTARILLPSDGTS